MRILVTGGTGFIGKPLVRGLASLGHNVAVFAKREDVDLPDGVRMIAGDVRKKQELRRAGPADVVYHLAATNEEDDPELWDVNVNGTQKIAELCSERKVKQIVFTSYAGVLGDSRHPVREHSHYAPKTKFDKSKAAAERIIKNSGIPYTIIRMPTVMGASVNWAKIFEAIKNGHPMIGGGGNKFHIAHVDDVVRLLIEVGGNRKAQDHIFNVATKDIMTYKEAYDTMCKLLRTKPRQRSLKVAKLLSDAHWLKTAIQAYPTSPHLSKSHIHAATRDCVLSIQKARDVLGFEPYYTSPMAINMAIKDVKS